MWPVLGGHGQKLYILVLSWEALNRKAHATTASVLVDSEIFERQNAIPGAKRLAVLKIRKPEMDSPGVFLQNPRTGLSIYYAWGGEARKVLPSL